MAVKSLDAQTPGSDSRHVVLIKSLATNNRFYALVDPETGPRNADTVERMPEDLILGIAYPCLEDGLNDFAVIRTTFETIDYFPDDDEMRGELMHIVNDARTKLRRRLGELRDSLASRRAYFLGTDLAEFKSYVMDVISRGYPRRNLDSMMKLNVFASVADHEPNRSGGVEPLYFYQFRNPEDHARITALPPREFVAALFGDVLDSVNDDLNYDGRFVFDRNVFQKFIALMFVNYATTDPVFYGTNKADYGVSGDKDMNDTPLYLAIGREIREIELAMAEEGGYVAPAASTVSSGRLDEGNLVQLPGTMINEDILLGPVASICASARRVMRQGDRESSEFARVILADASRLVGELKRLGIVSTVALDPGQMDGNSVECDPNI